MVGSSNVRSQPSTMGTITIRIPALPRTLWTSRRALASSTCSRTWLQMIAPKVESGDFNGLDVESEISPRADVSCLVVREVRSEVLLQARFRGEMKDGTRSTCWHCLCTIARGADASRTNRTQDTPRRPAAAFRSSRTILRNCRSDRCWDGGACNARKALRISRYRAGVAELGLVSLNLRNRLTWVIRQPMRRVWPWKCPIRRAHVATTEAGNQRACVDYAMKADPGRTS